MNRREKISAVDTAWLRMDRPGNLMMICGVMFFRERVDRLSAAVNALLKTTGTKTPAAKRARKAAARKKPAKTKSAKR